MKFNFSSSASKTHGTASNWLKNSEPAFLISPSLFVFSLIFSSFYIRDTHEAYYGFSLLPIGWLGILYLHFSWLANPMYFFALMARKSNPGRSFFLAICGFLIALEFLRHKSIITDEGGGTAEITGIGWGYYLWLMSILTLSHSSLKQSNLEGKHWIQIGLFGVATATTIGFAQQYYLLPGNHYSLMQQREKQFTELCLQSGESFYSTPSSPITGIYFSERGGSAYSKFIGNRYTMEEGGIFSSGGISKIPLIELKNDSSNSTQPFIRKNYGVGPDQPVANLESNYLVMIKKTSDSIPRNLDLYGREIVILELGRDQPLARMTFAVSRNDNRFCGKLYNGRFSEQDFVFRALQLIE